MMPTPFQTVLGLFALAVGVVSVWFVLCDMDKRGRP